MADNINVKHDPTIDTVPVATDDIGGVHYPIYKMAYGADGSQTPVDGTHPLPISGPVTLVDPNDATREQEFDPLFKAPLVIDIGHHEVHEGDAFSRTHYDEDAANNHLVQIYIETPATVTPQKHIHLIESHGGSGEHYISITEGITYSAGGADATPSNRHRGSAKVTAAQTFKIGSSKASNVITYTGGEVIYDIWMGSGKSQGGEGRGTTEWILAPSTEYIFEIQSKAAGTLIALALSWYEHTDG